MQSGSGASGHHTAIADSSPYNICPGLVCIPHGDDRPAREGGITTQGYLVTSRDGTSVLGIDTVPASVVDAVEQQCSAGGKTLKGVFITHRHVMQSAKRPEGLHAQTRFRKYVRDNDVAVLVHDADAARLANEVEAQVPEDLRLTFQEPSGHPLLKDFDMQVVAELHGHTEGGTLLLWKANGGIIFTGDCAMGAKTAEAVKLTRPPNFTSVSDDQLKQEWADVTLPDEVSGFCSLHGRPSYGLSQQEVKELRLHMGRHEPITAI
ncbi:hypothetical protein WJX72_010152 [[Myrmecia] bisecta]|uniref:Metallo-beta-lactamase domain-containing protein n=1 Tax=[Myrmecia] bisecta TaxID=41462 RepID=A0AAW1PEC5_9CHLO